MGLRNKKFRDAKKGKRYLLISWREKAMMVAA
jgi:hypothetical protein